jgi:serine/threonine protein kinase
MKFYKDKKGEDHTLVFVQVAPKTEELFENEIDRLAKLKHPCIVGFEGYSLPDRTGKAMIMSEFMPNGTLDENIRRTTPEQRPRLTSPTKLAKIVSGVVLGMRFMHSRGVFHRDLKPSNLFIDSLWQVRIATFCASRFAKLGHPDGLARESFDDGERSEAMDVCSFGLILYKIIVGESAFSPKQNKEDLVALIMKGSRIDIPRKVPREARRMIKRCCSEDPKKRPQFGEILMDLKRIRFQILPGVKSQKVFNFVTEIELWEENQRLEIEKSTSTDKTSKSESTSSTDNHSE